MFAWTTQTHGGESASACDTTDASTQVVHDDTNTPTMTQHHDTNTMAVTRGPKQYHDGTYEDDDGKQDGRGQQPHRDAEHDLLEATHRLDAVNHVRGLAEEGVLACTPYTQAQPQRSE